MHIIFAFISIHLIGKKNDKTQNEKLNNTSIRVNAFSSPKIICSNNSKFIEQWLIALSSIQCISNA